MRLAFRVGEWGRVPSTFFVGSLVGERLALGARLDALLVALPGSIIPVELATLSLRTHSLSTLSSSIDCELITLLVLPILTLPLAAMGMEDDRLRGGARAEVLMLSVDGGGGTLLGFRGVRSGREVEELRLGREALRVGGAADGRAGGRLGAPLPMEESVEAFFVAVLIVGGGASLAPSERFVRRARGVVAVSTAEAAAAARRGLGVSLAAGLVLLSALLEESEATRRLVGVVAGSGRFELVAGGIEGGRREVEGAMLVERDKAPVKQADRQRTSHLAHYSGRDSPRALEPTACFSSVTDTLRALRPSEASLPPAPPTEELPLAFLAVPAAADVDGSALAVPAGVPAVRLALRVVTEEKGACNDGLRCSDGVALTVDAERGRDEEAGGRELVGFRRAVPGCC